MLSLPFDHADYVTRALRKAFSQGHYAVDVFIVLSGYCLALQQRDRPAISYQSFLGARSLRLIPPYLFAVAFSLLLIVTLLGQKTGNFWDLTLPVSWRDVGLHLLLLHDWFADSAAKINPVFWSVAVEYKLYLAFPALLAATQRYGAWRVSASAMTAGYVVWLFIAYVGVMNPSAWGSSPYYFGLFVAGIAAAAVTEGRQPVSKLASPALSCSLGTLGALILASMVVRDAHRLMLLPLPVMSGVVGTFTALLLVSLELGKLKRVREWMSGPLLIWAGTIAYSMYLIHAPIVQLVYQYIVSPLHASTAITTAMTIGSSLLAVGVMSQLFFVAFERPFHRRSQVVTKQAQGRS